jgi:hypothetical protein
MKAKETKSVHVTFTLKKNTCPPVQLNNNQLTQTEDVKYLGTYLDRRLAWRKHITTNRKQLDVKLRKLYRINGRKSQLSLESKLFVYRTIFKPIWTYGIPWWGINIQLYYRHPGKIPIESTTNHNGSTVVCA